MSRSSELITNADGSIYHLGLLPHEVADTVILVGDPGRVARVSKHFDTLEVQKNRREFVTHTGVMRGKRMTVISSGISTDNIDIVINELDALVNVDLKTGRELDSHRALSFIRLGTSGSIREDLSVDSLICSAIAIGFDALDRYYVYDTSPECEEASKRVAEIIRPHIDLPVYVSKADKGLLDHFKSYRQGATLTCPGFYGPQGREVRAGSHMRAAIDTLSLSDVLGVPCTNIEMESSAIFFLADLFGHRALSVNAILANRQTRQFSQDPAATVDRMIEESLEVICAI